MKEGRKQTLGERLTMAEFPRLAAPPLWDLGNWFRTLRYQDDRGTIVQATINGGYAGIEDQRNYGDSSYKLYGYLPYDYPAVTAGTKMAQEAVLEIIDANAAAAAGEIETVTQVLVEGVVGDSKMPALLPLARAPKPRDFVAVNDADKYGSAAEIAWRFNPAAHLNDDDMLMENIPAVLDQVLTVRQWAPKARITIGPNSFHWHHPGRPVDARNSTQFGAAWCAALWKYLALASVDEVAFDVGPGPADAVQQSLGALAGRRLHHVAIRGPLPRPVEAFAVAAPAGVALWLVNLTDAPQPVEIPSIPAGLAPKSLTLQPYEVKTVMVP